MKNLFKIFIIYLALTKSAYSQSNLDSLGNIWFITIDKSGSMLWNSQHQYTLNNRVTIATNVANRFIGNSVFNGVNYSKDRFIFFKSGILHGTDLTQLKVQSRFDSSFIHHTDGILHSFKGKMDLVSHIQRLLEQSDYSYSYSFVSQIRLFSIIKGIDHIKDIGLSNSFNHIWLITITDDADQNDQWMSDYKTVKKYAPKKLTDVNEFTTKYLFNPFNTKSDISKSGTFIEKLIDDNEIPHINYYEYKTTQSSTIVADSNISLLAIHSPETNTVSLRVTKQKYNHDPILFYFVESMAIGNSTYIIDQYLTDTLNVSANLMNRLNYNNVLIRGYFQVRYTDSILGSRFKKYEFKQATTFPSAYLVTFQRRLKALIVILLAFITAYITFLLPRKKLFNIYDNQGRKYIARRGTKIWGPYHNWKKGENCILSFSLDDENNLNVVSKKQKNFIVSNHLAITGETAILIESYSPLAIENQKLILIKPFTTENDIEEHHEAKEYNSILESIYQKTIQCKLFKFAKKIKVKNRTFFFGFLKITNLFWKRYYYIVYPSRADFANTSISFSCKAFRRRTFTIGFSSLAQDQRLADENTLRNITCLNDFYSNAREYADGLITIHYLENQISWNVLKLDYQNNLRKIFHLFHFTQRHENTNDVKEKELNKLIGILSRLSKKAFPGTKRFKYCITNSTKPSSINRIEELNINNFEFAQGVYPSFLYLIEAKENSKRTSKKIFSPFKNGLQNEIITQTPSFGDYHMYSCFAPELAENGPVAGYCNKMAENIFSFTTMRDIQLTFDLKKEELHYSNHTINLNHN